MTPECEVPWCDLVAEIVIRDAVGVEQLVCWCHWLEMAHTSNGGIRGVGFIDGYGVDAPALCFRPDCDKTSVKVIMNIDGTRRAVCKQHWDDLSWVDFDHDSVLPDAPRWSGG